jgi:hypothetical protein
MLSYCQVNQPLLRRIISIRTTDHLVIGKFPLKRYSPNLNYGGTLVSCHGLTLIIYLHNPQV